MKDYTEIKFSSFKTLQEKIEFFQKIPTSKENFYKGDIWRLADEIVNEVLISTMSVLHRETKSLNVIRKIQELAFKDHKNGCGYSQLSHYVLNDLPKEL